MMELKEYQEQALGAFEKWLAALEEARAESEKRLAVLEDAGLSASPEERDFPRKAWQSLADAGDLPQRGGDLQTWAYVPRTDDAERPIPHACFKVPTGGGKTLLAAAALERMHRSAGLVLWVVPTRAIYQQTKRALWSREHPYRQMLEHAGPVKMLEKETPFTASDLANYLCVMLLMLPATNREKGKEFLRMFRDSGRYPTLFPDGDDVLSDQRLLNEHPDLERTSAEGPVKHSLFNVFKMQRPVVVLDEAHKAYGKPDAAREFVRSVNRFDPQLVIELSATPHPLVSNLLVDVSGIDLKDEEMIKLPVQVVSHTGSDWKHTLQEAAAELERLDAEAQSLQAGEGRYVRPIAVVRVERTGKEQRDGERVHAEDVREHLTVSMAVPPDAVRVKSSEKDELAGEDLLTPESPVRWIITKAALMEGWDCAFAYLLVMLDNTKTERALTQLTGRVMRMPDARRTGRQALDQCYVYCWNASVGAVVQQVKNGLEHEGLTGLGDDVWGKGAGASAMRKVERREQFRGIDIFLPRVLHEDESAEGGLTELDYDRHLLPEVPWGGIAAPEEWQWAAADAPKRETAEVDVGDAPPSYTSEDLAVDKTLSVEWFARRLADIVPNPWQAARMAQEFIGNLRSAGQSDEAIYDRRTHFAFVLRSHVQRECDSAAQLAFREKLSRGALRFSLKASGANYSFKEFYEVPVHESDRTFQKEYGAQLALNLFEPVFEREFDSDLERAFARYLDEKKALQWWHRVAARQRNEYYLRGWRRDRIYPDFIAFTADEEYGSEQLFVFETKGEHLKGNDDTEYKKQVLEILERAFDGGFMELHDGPAKGTFRLVFSENEFGAALASLQA